MQIMDMSVCPPPRAEPTFPDISRRFPTHFPTFPDISRHFPAVGTCREMSVPLVGKRLLILKNRKSFEFLPILHAPVGADQIRYQLEYLVPQIFEKCIVCRDEAPAADMQHQLQR